MTCGPSPELWLTNLISSLVVRGGCTRHSQAHILLLIMHLLSQESESEVRRPLSNTWTHGEIMSSD
jgi:hypothetical protein